MKSESWNPLLKSYPDSERVNAVSIGAETLYTRLIAQTDDAGHYYGEARWVLAKLFTARMLNRQVSEKDVADWIGELERVGLIRRYDADGSTYLELVNVKKRLRRDVKLEIRFPACTVLATDAGRARNESGPLDPDPDPEPNPEPPAPPAAAGDHGKPLAVEIPPELQTDAFKEAWESWQQHRREIRKKLTPSTAQRQLKDLAAMGEARAITAINNSIKHGWTGLFEDNNERKHTTTQQRADKAGREFAEDLRL